MKTMTLVSKNNDALVFQIFNHFSVLEALGKIKLNSMLLRHRLECKKATVKSDNTFSDVCH